MNFFQRILAAGTVLRGGYDQLLGHFARMRSTTGGMSPGPASPYRQVSAVRSVVARKANALAMMPFRLSTAADQLIENNDVLDLIHKPNPFMSALEFFRAIEAFLDLTGECHLIFTQMIGEKGPTARPTEIVPVGAQQMTPIYGPDMSLQAWMFTPYGIWGLPPQRIELWQVWTLRLNSYDVIRPWRGTSPLEAAGLPLNQVWKADIANEASLDNGVEPGGAYVMPGAKPTDDQIKDIRRQLEDRQGGARNRSRPLILYGGVTWQTIARAFAEMEFSTLKKMSIVDICAALEVDPAAVGYYEDSNFAHADAAKASFWIDTMIPRAMWIADELQRGIISRFNNVRTLGMSRPSKRAMSRRQICSRGYKAAREQTTGQADLIAWFDDSSVPAVQQANLTRAQAGAVWLDKFLATPEDVIEALNLPLPIHPWQQTARVPLGVVPVEEEGMQTGAGDAPAPAPGSSGTGSPAPAPGSLPKVPGEKEEPAETDTEDEEEEEMGNRGKALTAKHKEHVWELWRSSWSGIERALRQKVNGHFMELRRATLEKLNAQSGKSKSVVQRDSSILIIGDVLFDLLAANKSILTRSRPYFQSAVRLGGEQSMTEAAQAQGADEVPSFIFDDPAAQAALRARETSIVGINRTLRKELSESLADGLQAQESVEELSSRVRGVFNVASNRARTIAMTEVGAAVEEGRQVGRKQAGIPRKSWLWSRKETGRPWHMALEQETDAHPIPNEQKFVSSETGATAMQPRGFHVAQEDINCGCTTLARFDGESAVEMYTRYLQRGFLSFEQMQQKTIGAKP